jgi:hypothetical protein
MASRRDLEAAIDKLLDHPLGHKQYVLSHKTAEKAYEAYVFCLCLRAARDLGAAPKLRGINGPPNPFWFRGAPGQIHSTSKNYGYASFTLGGSDFEVHAGVEFKGTSGMTHELDVCIMRAEEARVCRQNPDDPQARSLVAGWECKFYAGPLPKSLGRTFVGLVDDLGTNMRVSGLCSNATHPQLRLFLSPMRRPDPQFGLTPLMPANENIFVSQLQGALKKLTGV